MPENGAFSCVLFCLRSLERFERCGSFMNGPSVALFSKGHFKGMPGEDAVMPPPPEAKYIIDNGNRRFTIMNFQN